MAYHEYGSASGGPQQVADDHYALVTAHRAGDYLKASRLLGVLSHYYSDICQPYHADSRGSEAGRAHRYPPSPHPPIRCVV